MLFRKQFFFIWDIFYLTGTPCSESCISRTRFSSCEGKMIISQLLKHVSGQVSFSSPCWRLLVEVLLAGQALLKDPPALKTRKFVNYSMISFFDETFWERLILIQRGIHLYWLVSSLNSEFFVKVWQFLKCCKWWHLLTLGAVHALHCVSQIWGFLDPSSALVRIWVTCQPFSVVHYDDDDDGLRVPCSDWKSKYYWPIADFLVETYWQLRKLGRC